MARYFLLLSYDGSNYKGWQVQPNTSTVEGSIEYCLSKLLGYTVDIIGCGRTDTGVHAAYYAAHFDAVEPLDCSFLQFRLNRFLPNDIAIHSIRPVRTEAHARYSALSRTYTYEIALSKEVFDRHYLLHYSLPEEVDSDMLSKLNRLAGRIRSYDEFYPFCKSESGVNHYRCRITTMKWYQPKAKRLRFEITANRFLRGMVRLLVGAQLNVLIGKHTEEDIIDALERQCLLSRSWSVPAHPLFLRHVDYPKEIFYPISG